jgi:ZIP family zinc transporter
MIDSALPAIIWGGLAASSLLIGYYLAERGLSNRTIGLIMGFGAGALISAIAYELVPESKLTGLDMALAFGLGALAFFVGDWMIDRRGGADRKDIAGGKPGGSGAAIFIGTLLDNVPESIVLGMSLVLGGSVSVAFLAAVFVSNLPEGVAGSINLGAAGHTRPSRPAQC